MPVAEGRAMALSIGTTFRQATAALWRRRWTIGLIALCWVALQTALGAGRFYFGIVGLSDATEWISTFVPGFEPTTYARIVDIVAAALGIVVGAPFAVLLIRLFFFDAPLAGEPGAAKLPGSMAAVAVFESVLTIAFAVIVSVVHFIAAPLVGSAWAPVYFAIWLTAVWVGSRFCLVYATAALGDGWQGMRSWRATSGHAVRLSVLFGVVLAVEAGVGQLAEAGIAVLFEAYRSVLLLSATNLRLTIVLIAFPASLVRIVFDMLLLALVAAIHARLSDRPAAGIPGAPRSAGQTAEVFD
ncbi:MAG: hypothetical protein HKM95_04080 [Inquilinus sp.]|nr:hypothetical protein [Inquilinus sp.]